MLDVGCGPGRYLFELLENYNISSGIGVDSGESIIERNKERFKDTNLKFEVGSCGDLTKFNDETFDFVISNGVMHHSGIPLDICIPEHTRVLKKDGLSLFLFMAQVGLN